jgi:flagellin
VASVDFQANLDLSGNLTAITDTATAATALGEIEAFIQTAVDGAAALGAASSRLESQSSFVSKLTDSLTSGVGALVDADLEETSARLQALQVQQQLATQSLSIANQAPQAILSLFRN